MTHPQATNAKSPKANPFCYQFPSGLADLLQDLGVSLLVTTYQAGKLMAVRATQGRVSTLLRSFEQPMGLALNGNQLALGTKNAIWFLRNAADIAPQLDPPNTHDACWVPRTSHVTGDIRCHDIAWAGDELWIVNTRFSCLCTLNPDYSFVPRWQPPFISKLAAEDRCHLNGLAVANGTPKYVTALGENDTPEGWRPRKASGGILINVPSNEIISHGLSMPHSPRVYAGKLWVLNSGEGELQMVDPVTGKRDTVAQLPGYTRGLCFYDKYAFVGLSKIREKKEFGGLPIEQREKDLKCGIWVVHIETGEVVGFMEFQAGCEELFAVEVLPGIRWPAIIGFQKDTISGIFVVPPNTII